MRVVLKERWTSFFCVLQGSSSPFTHNIRVELEVAQGNGSVSGRRERPDDPHIYNICKHKDDAAALAS